mmetsp:Transcript_13746/g.48511  ORF Transcript_13746/g.48511 Transcript_13746/m.48511 type:complete len:255 (-) Transcript_13746:2354-3118(-)
MSHSNLRAEATASMVRQRLAKAMGSEADGDDARHPVKPLRRNNSRNSSSPPLRPAPPPDDVADAAAPRAEAADSATSKAASNGASGGAASSRGCTGRTDDDGPRPVPTPAAAAAAPLGGGATRLPKKCRRLCRPTTKPSAKPPCSKWQAASTHGSWKPSTSTACRTTVGGNRARARTTAMLPLAPMCFASHEIAECPGPIRTSSAAAAFAVGAPRAAAAGAPFGELHRLKNSGRGPGCPDGIDNGTCTCKRCSW